MTDEDLIVDLNRLFWLLEEDRQYLPRANTVRLAARRIEAQAAEIERLRAYLDRIEKVSEFFTNPEHSELTLRYAHEGTQRLAREALTGDNP